MRKFIGHITLFIAPILVLLVILPVNKRLKYQGLKDDCLNHGIWVHDRIFENEKPIDYAFLGSSHTINSINDKLINENIDNGEAVNLGYCRFGRNLHYIILKELLSKKKVKHIFLEVREDENGFSHPIFPFMAETRDVLLAPPFLNHQLFSDIWTHHVYKIELMQDELYKQEKEAPINLESYGFSASYDTASSTFLEEIKTKRSQPKRQESEFERDFNKNYVRAYLAKINELCKENEVKLSFIYLPSFASIIEKPKEMNTYLQYGEVIIPPKSIFDNKDYWHDENHFNHAGAAAISLWLSEEIKKL